MKATLTIKQLKKLIKEGSASELKFANEDQGDTTLTLASFMKSAQGNELHAAIEAKVKIQKLSNSIEKHTKSDAF